MTNTERQIYSVSELNRMTKLILEDSFPLIWLEAEISNLAKPSSGHWYFSLKDAKAQVRCAMFRMRTTNLNFKPENGMQVLVQARVSLYEGRGEFQLIIEHMEAAGDGALQRTFEALKKLLHEQGLFASEHKKPLPKLPSCIGVVTSPTGAAIRDILSVLKRRFPTIPVIIYPTAVQGDQAAGQIVKAIQQANQRNECDVLLVSRGGGSLEDLWPFNEEIVARAIYASTIPIVSGVGHEVDTTIADFVADQRAPTPSAAAELVSPDRLDWQHKVSQLQARLQHHIRNTLAQANVQLKHLRHRLKHPGQVIQERSQHCDYLEQRLRSLWRQIYLHKIHQLNKTTHALEQNNPQQKLQAYSTACRTIADQLRTSIKHYLHNKQQQFANTSRALHAVSPLNTLSRGYAIATHNNHIVKSVTEITLGDMIQIRLHQGTVECDVNKIIP
ncbi:MAG: exodeoxyribonuclease VII large subunit [Pseudomonadota bacterium]|nr:exodeoxyribonuclease VII large subunit [Pseudomonadota bacterium]